MSKRESKKTGNSNQPSKLDAVCSSHYQLYMIRHFAATGAMGVVAVEPADSEGYKFVVRVNNTLATAESTFRRCNLHRNQIEYSLPEKYLALLGETELYLMQENVDLCTIFLCTMLDHSLHLINEIFSLNLRPQQCTYKKVSTLIVNERIICDELRKLAQYINTVVDTRHAIVHRGGRREFPIHNAIYRGQLIVKQLTSIPTTSIKWNTSAARRELVSAIDSDIATVNSLFTGLKNALVPQYETHLANVGGLQQPSRSEKRKAIRAMKYFRDGGDPPEWW